MAYIKGTATFTNGSATVTSVSLNQGVISLVSSGTNLVVGFDPVVGNIEATGTNGTDITLRNVWSGTTGSYEFVAFDTIEGLADAVQSARGFSTALQDALNTIGTPSTTVTPDSIAKRDSAGRLESATGASGNDVLTFGNVQTSATDATAGRVLKVGTSQSAFSAEAKSAIDGARDANTGLTNIVRLNGADCNAFLETGGGKYGINWLNAPTDSSIGILFTTGSSSLDSGRAGQIFHDTSQDKIFYRVKLAGAWRPWQELYHTGNTGSVQFAGAFNNSSAGTENKLYISPDSGLNGNNNGAIGFETDVTTTRSHLWFKNGNGTVGSVITNGSSTAYNTSSDNRLKDVIGKPTDDDINAKFNDIFDAFTCFNWKNNPDGDPVWGFLAHDVIDKGLDFGSEGEGPRDLEIGDVYEQATYDEDGNEIEPEKTVTPAGVDQSKVVPYLVAKIEQLERRLAELENK